MQWRDVLVVTTVKDVAKAAGVSPSTVSRALAGKPTVDPELVVRVQRAASDLQYRPSRIARSLRTRESRVWGVVVSDLRNPFYTDLLRGLEDTAQEAGYLLVIGNADERVEKETSYLELFVAERVAGVVLSAASQANAEVAMLRNQQIPLVVIDRAVDGENVDTVLADNVGGAFAATSHLISQGYRRIACIAGPADRTTSVDRLSGYLRAHAEAGLAIDESLIRHSDFRQAGGYATVYELLTGPLPPDALFVCNNLMAIGALEAAAQLGLRHPEDLGLVAFDEIPLASLLRSPVSVVAQPAYQIGSEAARLLLKRAQGDTAPPRRIVLPVELRVRASSLRQMMMPGSRDGRSGVVRTTAGT